MDKITIIVPVYNAENTIERCLASFISNRDYIQEVILVNDRSTDRTFEKIDQFKSFFNIRVINNTGNKGPGPGRKTGLLEAYTDWITFVDADDCLTPNSLYYVFKELKQYPEVVLFHTQSIYYETGLFNKDAVSHSDFSCGGNFYKRKYLIEHNLFPHEELFMSEDEYFNYIVTRHIQHYANEETMIQYYDYPVYEVHHDRDQEVSFSYQSWADYLCTYHLLCTQYRIEFFKNDPNLFDVLKQDAFNDFIFCFYLFEGVLQDENVSFDQEPILQAFHNFAKYCQATFNITDKDLTHYYLNYKNRVQGLYEAACGSVGFEIETLHYFSKFTDIIFNFKVRQ